MAHTNLCISLRQATHADSAFAYQVKKVALGEYIQQTYGRWDEAFQREFHDRQWDPAGTQIIVVNGVDAGWVWVTQHADYLRVDGIYLVPQYQGCGIGTDLLTRLKDEAFRAGKSVRLWVMKVNPAVAFYKQVGFSVIGETQTHWHMEALA